MTTESNQLSAKEYRPVVLSVDDCPSNLLAVSTLLGDLNATVVNATSGQQALEIALARHDIAVILLDVQMPGMGGFETAETLRRLESTKHVPILFVTATNTEAEHIFQGHETAAVDYLARPIQKHILVRKVRVFLDMACQRYLLLQTVGELEESRVDLTRNNEILQEFVHSAAHDLKAPIRHITAWVDMMREDEGDNIQPGTSEMLNRIGRSAQRLHDLVGGMLAFATVDTEAPVMKKVDLSAVVAAVLDEFHDAIADCHAEVQVEPLPLVVGHPGLLLQLFQNLVSNCLKYRRTEVTPKILVTCDEASGAGGKQACQFCVSVSDNGTGFDQEHAPLIFMPFRRLVSSAIEGSGFGMASARKIAQLHGGELSAQGVPDQGATFTVTLPRAEKQPRLLIVDDEQCIREMTCKALASTGFELVTVESAQAALDVLSGQPVFAVLCDYHLPERNGLWLLERIKKQHPKTLRLLTSNVQPQEMVAAQSTGLSHGFLEKVTTADKLFEALNSPEGEESAAS